jgi:hypothetical protein
VCAASSTSRKRAAEPCYLMQPYASRDGARISHRLRQIVFTTVIGHHPNMLLWRVNASEVHFFRV